jgi:hypothetical protein
MLGGKVRGKYTTGLENPCEGHKAGSHSYFFMRTQNSPLHNDYPHLVLLEWMKSEPSSINTGLYLMRRIYKNSAKSGATEKDTLENLSHLEPDSYTCQTQLRTHLLGSGSFSLVPLVLFPNLV